MVEACARSEIPLKDLSASARNSKRWYHIVKKLSEKMDCLVEPMIFPEPKIVQNGSEISQKRVIYQTLTLPGQLLVAVAGAGTGGVLINRLTNWNRMVRSLSFVVLLVGIETLVMQLKWGRQEVVT